MDAAVRQSLARYLSEIASLPNESAKTHRFVALVEELFPKSRASLRIVQGIEKRVRIDLAAGGQRRGRIDSYFGNAVVEFETSLRATLRSAEKQLREYTAAVWNEEGGDKRPLVAVATDGIAWRVYRPTLAGDAPRIVTAENVELQPIRQLDLAPANLDDFYIWLVGLLFREQQQWPTLTLFRADFGTAGLAYYDALEALERAWKIECETPEGALKYDTWQRYLTFTYGALASSDDLGTLFLKHTYLASLAKLLVWAHLSRGRTTAPLRVVAEQVLSGEYFASRQIENLVEDDFFQWVRTGQAQDALAPVWERILAQLLTYDLSRLSQDILKGVYQELVDPKDRHDLGEYYTPDWLCERVVSELLPATGFPTVLDPTCGSGSFLRAAITHIREANSGRPNAEQLGGILEGVMGIDIHPLAVTISRATYVLALGELALAARRPVRLPVYLADSLFVPTEVEQIELGKVRSFEIRFGDRRVQLPEAVVEDPGLFDATITAASDVAADHAKTRAESAASLRAYLDRSLSEFQAHAQREEIVTALWHFAEQLAQLIRARKNSIWAFIIRNSYRPALLKRRFDYIVGNPPWLSYRYISDPDYQAEIKRRAIREYGVAPVHQRLMTHMELATVFLAHAISVFGSSKAKLGFVMPRSVLSADQHARIRDRSYAAHFILTEVWDLKDVRPLFNVPSCVLFARREVAQIVTSYSLPFQVWEGSLPQRDVPWRQAQSALSSESKTGNLIYLGQRTALAIEPGRRKPHKGSAYKGRFKQGATIVPRNFYFVSAQPAIAGIPEADRLYWIQTDEEQARTAKKPYNEVRLKGNVEGQFLYSAAISRHVLPFAVIDPALVVLPLVNAQNGAGTVLDSKALKAAGYRAMARWMAQAEQIWNAAQGRKKARLSAVQRVDYHGGLTSQDLSTRYLVLYNAAGTDLSAAVFDRQRLPVPFVVEHKLYYVECETRAEAYYLTGVLNAKIVNTIIKPFQSLGQQGERDIEKKVLELPIPLYQRDDELHREIAELAETAEGAALTVARRDGLPGGLAARRRLVRQETRQLRRTLSAMVRRLLAY